jgi:hypothetical protein
MFHELYTLLREIISEVSVIKKVPTNMVSFLTDYSAMGVFSFCNCTPARSAYNSWSSIMCYTTTKGALWQKLEFSKTCSEQRSLSITGNFKKLPLDIKFK